MQKTLKFSEPVLEITMLKDEDVVYMSDFGGVGDYDPYADWE